MWVPESGSGMQSPVAMAMVMQSNLRAVGVNVTLQTMEWGAYIAKLRTKEQDLFALSWAAGSEDPDMVMYPLFHSSQWTPNGPNRAMYKNEKFDALLARGAARSPIRPSARRCTARPSASWSRTPRGSSWTTRSRSPRPRSACRASSSTRASTSAWRRSASGSGGAGSVGPYLARRLLHLGPVLLGVSVIVFMVLHLAPGDPAEVMLGANANKEDLDRLRPSSGSTSRCTSSTCTGSATWLRGDLGRSLWMKRPVLGEVLERFKATLLLTGSALLLSTLGGIALGIASATRANSLLDRLSGVASLFGASMPVFWLGIVLMVIFSLWLGWLPASGMYAPYGGGGLRDLLAHLVLPAVTLAAASVTIIARLTRATMLETLGQDYVRTARAKGLGERAVVLRHALKNALIPIVTVVGVQAGYLLGGAVLTETVFAWPGVGTLVVQGILARDMPLVQGGVLVIALSFVLVNLAVDPLYAWLDPRIRFE